MCSIECVLILENVFYRMCSHTRECVQVQSGVGLKTWKLTRNFGQAAADEPHWYDARRSGHSHGDPPPAGMSPYQTNLCVLSVCLSVCRPACLPACLPSCLSFCLSVCLCACVRVCVCVYIYIHIYMHMRCVRVRARVYIYICIHVSSAWHETWAHRHSRCTTICQTTA